MFNNIGEKIKSVAVVVTIIGIAVSFLYGGWLIFTGSWLFGVCTIIIGSISSWLASLVLYGFGQLVSNSDSMVELQEEQNEMVEKKLVYKDIVETKKEKISQQKKSGSSQLKNKGFDLTDLYEKAKEDIQHLKFHEKQLLKEMYPQWYKEIREFSLEELAEILDDKGDNRDFDYLCCIEIVDRLKSSK